MTHSGDAEVAPRVVHEPFRIRLRGEDVVLTDEEATEIQRELQRQSYEFDLADGDMLTDVLVIAKVPRLDGETTVWEPYNREEDR